MIFDKTTKFINPEGNMIILFTPKDGSIVATGYYHEKKIDSVDTTR